MSSAEDLRRFDAFDLAGLIYRSRCRSQPTAKTKARAAPSTLDQPAAGFGHCAGDADGGVAPAPYDGAVQRRSTWLTSASTDCCHSKSSSGSPRTRRCTATSASTRRRRHSFTTGCRRPRRASLSKFLELLQSQAKEPAFREAFGRLIAEGEKIHTLRDLDAFDAVLARELAEADQSQRLRQTLGHLAVELSMHRWHLEAVAALDNGDPQLARQRWQAILDDPEAKRPARASAERALRSLD